MSDESTAAPATQTQQAPAEQPAQQQGSQPSGSQPWVDPSGEGARGHRAAPHKSVGDLLAGMREAEAAADRAAAAPTQQAPAAQGQTAQAQTQQPADQAKTEPDPNARKPLPPRGEGKERKPSSPREHILSRIAAKQAREQAEREQQGLAAKVTELESRYTNELAELQRIRAAKGQGKVDEIAKTAGYKDFSEMQEEYLGQLATMQKERGANIEQHPAFLEMKRIAEETAQRLEARERAEREAQEAEELQRLVQGDIDMVRRGMIDSGFERLDKLAELPFAVQLGYQSMAERPELDDVEHYRFVDDTYARLVDTLAPIYGWSKADAGAAQPAAQTGTAAQRAPAKPPVAVPQSGATETNGRAYTRPNQRELMDNPRARSQDRRAFIQSITDKFASDS